MKKGFGSKDDLQAFLFGYLTGEDFVQFYEGSKTVVECVTRVIQRLHDNEKYQRSRRRELAILFTHFPKTPTGEYTKQEDAKGITFCDMPNYQVPLTSIPHKVTCPRCLTMMKE